MSNTIFLVLLLVILTTIICNNPVCTHRGSLNGQFALCGCRIHPNKHLQCMRGRNPKTKDEYKKIVLCICKNLKNNSNDVTKRQFQKICNPIISIPL